MRKILLKSLYKRFFRKINNKIFTDPRSFFIRKFQKNFHKDLASPVLVLAINPGVDINFGKILALRPYSRSTKGLAG